MPTHAQTDRTPQPAHSRLSECPQAPLASPSISPTLPVHLIRQPAARDLLQPRHARQHVRRRQQLTRLQGNGVLPFELAVDLHGLRLKLDLPHDIDGLRQGVDLRRFRHHPREPAPGASPCQSRFLVSVVLQAPVTAHRARPCGFMPAAALGQIRPKRREPFRHQVGRKALVVGP